MKVTHVYLQDHCGIPRVKAKIGQWLVLHNKPWRVAHRESETRNYVLTSNFVSFFAVRAYRVTRDMYYDILWQFYEHGFTANFRQQRGEFAVISWTDLRPWRRKETAQFPKVEQWVNIKPLVVK